MILSPWTDLSNFTKFTFTSYDFEVNREIWQHHYQAIFRANQVIARVPAIPMDATLRDRIVGEAKFIRALMYLNLVTLYGNRSEEHTSELQSQSNLVCRLLLEKKKKKTIVIEIVNTEYDDKILELSV